MDCSCFSTWTPNSNPLCLKHSLAVPRHSRGNVGVVGQFADVGDDRVAEGVADPAAL